MRKSTASPRLRHSSANAPQEPTSRSILCQSGSYVLTPVSTGKQIAFAILKNSTALNPLSELAQMRRLQPDASRHVISWLILRVTSPGLVSGLLGFDAPTQREIQFGVVPVREE